MNTVQFEDDYIVLNKEVKINFSDIKKIIYDRENKIGTIICGDMERQSFEISLKQAYLLIAFMCTPSEWVNL